MGSLNRDAVEEKIGAVTDYLDRMGSAVIRLTDGDLLVNPASQCISLCCPWPARIESRFQSGRREHPHRVCLVEDRGV